MGETIHTCRAPDATFFVHVFVLASKKFSPHSRSHILSGDTPNLAA